MIAIIDYGMGNLRSVQKALEKVAANAMITSDPKVIASADKIVLPGVGAMAPAMERLQELDLIPVIKKTVESGKPFLGICLGLQLLFESSNEGGSTPGLGILKGSVERFSQLKVPHMGWNQLVKKQERNSMLSGVDDSADVYFCHSYYVKPQDAKVIATMTNYGIDFASSIARQNLWGVQFHPEKSQRVGLQILKNFVELTA